MAIFDRFKGFLNPEKSSEVESFFDNQKDRLPTIWLLGKTGAGKSTLIQTVTGSTHVQVGNGYSPCTMTAISYDFPEESPLMRFLDTRGLADIDYDPTEDIEACQDCSHALIVVMKAEEPEQSDVSSALRKISKSGRIKQALVVHTGICLIDNPQDRRKSISHNQQQAENAWGQALESVEIDFELEDGSSWGVDSLKEKLADRMPILAHLTADKEHADQEARKFLGLKTQVLHYASAAGATDAFPIVGGVSVPAIQAKMLHALAGQYGMTWNRKNMAEFAGALGAGIGVRYAARMGIRQIVKLIPVYGQTVGSATAAVVSFCSMGSISKHNSGKFTINRREEDFAALKHYPKI
ncbi:MAG: YcjF family protein [Thermodesulfobacteriota bacterium]